MLEKRIDGIEQAQDLKDLIKQVEREYNINIAYKDSRCVQEYKKMREETKEGVYKVNPTTLNVERLQLDEYGKIRYLPLEQ